MRLRREAYENGKKDSFSPPCACVSVGNIGWGGSGKTPLVAWLLEWAREKELKAVTLTRGYKASPPSTPFLVRADSKPEFAGDEPLLLARAHAEAKIVVDPDRARAGAWAWGKFKPDLFVLDDGFQHLKVRRHVDLVLLRPKDLEHEWDRVIPAGSWREGAGALKRATAFLIKAPEETFTALVPLLQNRLKKFNKPVFNFFLEPVGLKQVASGESALDFQGKAYILASAIAEPDQLAQTAAKLLGYPPREHRLFPDHHTYTQRDWRALRDASKRLDAPHILCTPKDAVKLERFANPSLWTLETDLRFGQTLFRDLAFPQWWDATWEGLKNDLRSEGTF